MPLGAEDGDDRDVDEVNGVMHQHRAYLRVQDVHPGRRVSVDGLGENAILPKTIVSGWVVDLALNRAPETCAASGFRHTFSAGT